MATQKDNNVQQYNIQPQAGVISVFSRLNYKPWYAVAEFVDNSTQSFYSNEDFLRQSGVEQVSIDIIYDTNKDILVIKDTAFGMEFKDFTRALKIDSPPEDKNGRNEFGMGLKTAASWFGDVWSVESTQFGSINKYFAEIDIPYMKKNNINTIDIYKNVVPAEEHGTIITIKQITKKLGAPRTKNKIIQLLSSMYRRDLNSGKVSISFDGQPLFFDEYDCLRFRDKEWRKTVDFSFSFDNKKYNVRGFVGILAHGGFGKAGLALFRRGRIVIGGEELNYKPDIIFGQAQSPIAHKLFGELDLDDFPINQAKDGFVWDDGLEEEFIHALKLQIKEYIEIAKLTNKERAKEEALSDKVSETVYAQVQEAINTSFGNLFEQSLQQDPTNSEVETDKTVDLFKKYQEEQNNIPEKVDEKIRRYSIQLDAASHCDINVQWILGDKTTYWIKIDSSEDGSAIAIQLNINHPFFKPFSEAEDFKTVLEKFALAFALAEYQAKQLAKTTGSLSPSGFRNLINQYLTKLAD